MSDCFHCDEGTLVMVWVTDPPPHKKRCIACGAEYDVYYCEYTVEFEVEDVE